MNAEPESDPRIAVVMITWNRRAEVIRSLGHFLELPERPKIILVDNGSTDGTAAAVAERFPTVEIVEAGRNLGTLARNLGVARCDRPYVALADDDTWWTPGSLRRAADLLDAHPRLAVACARVLIGPECREDPVCRELQDSPLPLEAGMPGPALLGFLAGASAVRRQAFLAAGGFPRDIGIGGEEQWLAAELASRGWWLCYASSLAVHHYPSIHRGNSQRRARILRNALWFAWLRRPLRSAVRVTIDLARTEPRGWSKVVGFSAGTLGVLVRAYRRRAVPPEVERNFQILEAGRAASSRAPALEDCRAC